MGGLDITVSSGLPHWLWRRGRRYTLPPVATSGEIAALGGIEETTLGESGWWARLRSRLARSATPWPSARPGPPPTGHPGTAEGAGQDGWSSAPGTATGGRGTARTPGRLLVWDWERSRQHDLLHFGYQTALGPRPAAGRRRHRQGPGGPYLAELGQRPELAELLCDLYLLERLWRAAEAEVSAVTGRPDTVGAALLGVLGRRLVPERSRGTG